MITLPSGKCNSGRITGKMAKGHGRRHQECASSGEKGRGIREGGVGRGSRDQWCIVMRQGRGREARDGASSVSPPPTHSWAWQAAVGTAH